MGMGMHRYWLWKDCPKCHHQWSLEKLGIVRDEQAFKPIVPPDVYIMEEDEETVDEDDSLMGIGPF